MQENLYDSVAQLSSVQPVVNPASQLRSALLARLGDKANDEPVRTLLSQFFEHTQEGRASKSQSGAAETITKMRKLLRSACAELRMLQVRSNKLAAALGACAECWGENSKCDRCGGMGGPGSVHPDPIAYNALVHPANEAMSEQGRNNP
jgi:hypothetical protein